MKSNKIYLDYNSTTPVDERVLEAMLPYFSHTFGNASSTQHAWGWDAEEAVTIAREQVASLVGVKPKEIYFTSGATEAINISLLGFCQAQRQKGNHIITCKTEHKAVLDTCNHLKLQDYKITCLDVDPFGLIDLDELEKAINEDTIMISLMHANNEIGIIHPLEEITKLAADHDIAFLTDATQSLGKIPLDLGTHAIDFAAFSAHKLYGPKGVGALYIKSEAISKISPLFFGGGQERSLRPGTLNVPGIVGFGKACELCQLEMAKDNEKLSHLIHKIENNIGALEGVIINGAQVDRLPHMTNFSFRNIDGSNLVRSLKNLAVSQGSACTSATFEPSHVLLALGHSPELALSSIRIGLGRQTTEEEVEIAIAEISKAVERLKLAAS